MSATLSDRLNPVMYLPDSDRVDTLDPAAHRLARAVLDETYPNIDFQHFSRSALAGSALYIASVVVSGADRVRQPSVADAVGTTEMSIRAHTEKLSQLALDNVNLEEYSAVDRDRLRHLAAGGSARDVIDA